MASAIPIVSFSLSDGGLALSDDLDHGAKSPNSDTTEQIIYISHDGLNPLTNCKLYLVEKIDDYAGMDSPLADKAELISWGDATTLATFGGIQFNFDAIGGFPSSAWGSVTSKDPTNGATIRTGYGDVSENGFLLPVAMSASMINAGEIPDGVAVSFKMRIKIPDSVSCAGIRQFDLRLRYSFI